MTSKQSKLPWQKWFWNDWFTAIDVQTLPRDTRCVWFEMLGRMWQSTERGFLTSNGKPLSEGHLSALLGFGTDLDAFRKHLQLIEDSGLFSRRESDGAIFSRKILKDEGIREQKANAGRHGGLATQRHKAGAVQELDEPEVLGYVTEEKELAGVRE